MVNILYKFKSKTPKKDRGYVYNKFDFSIEELTEL